VWRSVQRIEVRARLIETRVEREGAFELRARCGGLTAIRERAAQQIVRVRIQWRDGHGLPCRAQGGRVVIRIQRRRRDVLVRADVA
jgi:hypothetical protein